MILDIVKRRVLTYNEKLKRNFKQEEKRRCNKMYLGNSSFSNELRHSFDDFMETVVKVFRLLTI